MNSRHILARSITLAIISLLIVTGLGLSHVIASTPPKACSIEAPDYEATIIFNNKSSHIVAFYEMSFECQPIPRVSVPPLRSYVVNTGVGVIWRVLDNGTGNWVGDVTATPDPIGVDIKPFDSDPAGQGLALVAPFSSGTTPLPRLEQANASVPPPAPVEQPNATAAPSPFASTQWTPQIDNFDGVDMVEVPPGCFMMGSDNPPQNMQNQRPATKICFNHPFWIDRTDVTQTQFAQFGGRAAQGSYFRGANRPVESITWFEARDFCALRHAHLPTEAEWEYAARGPNNYLYPWGNVFDPSKVVYGRNSGAQTAEVGSKPAGASWVGALDMVGEVMQWVSTIHRSYPYNPDDGRESSTDTGSARGLRGAFWDVNNPDMLAATYRFGYSPTGADFSAGIRCAKAASAETLSSAPQQSNPPVNNTAPTVAAVLQQDNPPANNSVERSPSLPAAAEQELRSSLRNEYQGALAYFHRQVTEPPAYRILSAQQATKLWKPFFGPAPDEAWCVTIEPPVPVLGSGAGGFGVVEINLSHFRLSRTGLLWETISDDRNGSDQTEWLSLGCSNW